MRAKIRVITLSQRDVIKIDVTKTRILLLKNRNFICLNAESERDFDYLSFAYSHYLPDL